MMIKTCCGGWEEITVPAVSIGPSGIGGYCQREWPHTRYLFGVVLGPVYKTDGVKAYSGVLRSLKAAEQAIIAKVMLDDGITAEVAVSRIRANRQGDNSTYVYNDERIVGWIDRLAVS